MYTKLNGSFMSKVVVVMLALVSDFEVSMAMGVGFERFGWENNSASIRPKIDFFLVVADFEEHVRLDCDVGFGDDI